MVFLSSDKQITDCVHWILKAIQLVAACSCCMQRSDTALFEMLNLVTLVLKTLFKFLQAQRMEELMCMKEFRFIIKFRKNSNNSNI